MYTLYALVTGPLAWVAFIVCIGGILVRLIHLAVLASRRDPMVYAHFHPGYAARSLFHWLVPFNTTNMRRHPWMTIVAFAFHISVLVVPVFLLAHIVLVQNAWNISWWFLPDTVADVLSVVVVGGCVFFAVRRMVRPEVRDVSTVWDYLLVLAVAAPFVTGFWAQHQWPGFITMGIVHMISGELLLVLIPFTRLAHMIFFAFMRGYLGAEFGAVRHARDW
jgi:nitrate reductase gamma subunit